MMGMDRVDRQQITSAADADSETQVLAELYARITAQSEAAKQRRIDEGRAGFSDLDAAGRRAYILERQRECRARQRAQAKATGFAPLSIDAMREAIVDAVMILAAAGDAKVDPVLELAARAFQLPTVAAVAIRKKARRHRPRQLTEERLHRPA